jgi:hypothetical protein
VAALCSPGIQEQILFLSGADAGAIVERNLRSIARVSDFAQQERLFAQLLSRPDADLIHFAFVLANG